MELCDFIVPGTGVVDSFRVGPVEIKVASWAYRKLGRQTDEAKICSMRMAGLGNCDITKMKLIRELRAYVAVHGPVNATGHSQGGFQLARIFVEEPGLFNEVVILEAPIKGSAPARAGKKLAPGFRAMSPDSDAVFDLYTGLAALSADDRSRLHLYATANGKFVLPHTAALCDLEGIDNVWVGKGQPREVRGYARHLRTQRRVGHLDLIWRQELLDDVRGIFEVSAWLNGSLPIPAQRQPASLLQPAFS